MLWMWCLERDITIKAQYLPGVENVRADSESRVMQDRSDWMLNRQIFQAIQAQLGPVDLDLFASLNSHSTSAGDQTLRLWPRMPCYRTGKA